MEDKYLLGVDGGNSKTDYLLFDLAGQFVDGLRAKTCSHESLAGGFDGAYEEMNVQINRLLSRNNLKTSDISAAAFGLAGADVPYQKARLEEIIKRIGISHFIVDNDGFLGIKAAAPNGYGVCSINGTGTVNVGIDEVGNRIQVGGVGYISSDEAGGAFLCRRTFQAVYDELYRMGPKTNLTNLLFEKFNIVDKTKYLETIVAVLGSRTLERRSIIQMLFNQANQNDAVAISILEQAGTCMGLSIAGCINELTFTESVPIILAGSIWANATADHMLSAFKKIITKYVDKPCTYLILETAPASGAILWAYELATGLLPSTELRVKILTQVDNYQIKQAPTR